MAVAAIALGVQGAEDGPLASTGIDNAVLQALEERRATLDFADTPIPEALAQIARLAKVSIIMDPAAYKSTTVTMQVIDLPLKLALDWVMSFTNLSYTVKDGVVFVTTHENVTKSNVELRVYDVSDFNRTARDYSVPEYYPSRSDRGEHYGTMPTITLAEPASTSVLEVGTLEDLILKRVNPESWMPGRGTSITVAGDKFIVVNTPEVHERIGQLIEFLRQSTKKFLAVKGVVVQSSVFPEEDILDEAELQQFLKANGLEGKALRQRVVCYDSQRVFLQSGTMFNFVADYDVSGGVYDPVIRTGMEGHMVDIKPELVNDGKSVQMDFRFTVTGNKKDVRQGMMDIAGTGKEKLQTVNKEFIIDLPQVSMQKVGTKVSAPVGKYVLAAVMPGSDPNVKEAQWMLFLAAEPLEITAKK
jgi:hypothetical protein